MLKEDFERLMIQAIRKKYGFGGLDAFAIGYMCGKFGVDRLFGNQDQVIEACRKYDKTDELMILDTIGETLIDLEVIKNDGRI